MTKEERAELRAVCNAVTLRGTEKDKSDPAPLSLYRAQRILWLLDQADEVEKLRDQYQVLAMEIHQGFDMTLADLRERCAQAIADAFNEDGTLWTGPAMKQRVRLVPLRREGGEL